MSLRGKKILAVIPARGGSKGIPRKNIKKINSKPLIYYIIKTLIKTRYIDKIVVTSEDEYILNYVKKFPGVTAIRRNKTLSKDAVTLDSVIFDAYRRVSKKSDYDYIFTLQPTSPLISSETIEKAIKCLINSNYDSLITVVDDRHLRWTIKNNRFIPLYQKRLNRQYLPTCLKESGGIIACTDKVISKNTRIGSKIKLLQIPYQEAVEIDNYEDFTLVEILIKSPKLAYIVVGNKNSGLGHIYRAITIADSLQFKPLFIINKRDDLAINRIKNSNYEYIIYNKVSELDQILKDRKINLVINDTLNTKKDYIIRLKKNNRFVVSFEDFGEGVEYADLVFNALYENSNPPRNHYYGYEYYCLRDEFIFSDKKKIKKKVKNILITFGGVDYFNSTMYVFDMIKNYKNLNIEVIVGSGYKYYKKLAVLLKNYKNVYLYQSVDKISSHMLKADIIITSNGRTCYEAVSLGVPTLSISQNEQEIKHTFGDITKTVINLGLINNLNKKNFLNSFEYLLKSFNKRKELNKRMLKINLNEGIEKVINIIISKYYDFKKKEYI